MDVSIIIVNYNTKEVTLECISSIYKFTSGCEFEIIIVDNASIDGSQEAIKSTFPNLLLIENEKNLGFGSANNIGVEHSKGDFLFFLNSDTLLIENSIKILYDFYVDNESRLQIGVLGCILINNEGKITNSGGWFPKIGKELKGYYNSMFNLFCIPRKPPYEFIYFSNMTTRVDMVSGADMFMRISLFKEISGFDTDFFLYYEETDLQKRISNLKLTNYIINTTKIIHLEGSSVKGITNWKRTIIQKSRNLYLKKNEKKYYPVYRIVEILLTPLRFFNKNYSFKENYSFIKANLKSL